MRTFKKISQGLYKLSTGWVAIIGLIIFLLFTSLVLPAQSAEASKVSGDIGSPDTSFFYTPQSLYEMAEAYGDQGRVAYIQARFTFDIVWPIIYTLFLATSISWLFVHDFPQESRWRLANLAPVFGILFDYLENISTSWVMYRYPLTSPVAVWLAPFFTAVKWILVVGSFAILLIGALLFIWKLIRNH